ADAYPKRALQIQRADFSGPDVRLSRRARRFAAVSNSARPEARPGTLGAGLRNPERGSSVLVDIPVPRTTRPQSRTARGMFCDARAARRRYGFRQPHLIHG